jgi:hypothetical protein
MRFQGTDISVIALHYSGPSKVSTPLIAIGTNASLKGAVDYTFNFEKETGTLISYSIKESAPLLISSESTTFNMSRCAITITNSGNYTIKSEPWKIDTPTPTTTLTPASITTTETSITNSEGSPAPVVNETSRQTIMNQWAIIIAAVGIVTLVMAVLVIRRFKR